MSISTLILAGYAIVLAALAGLGWFAAMHMNRMRAITQDLYIHPFAVSYAAADMKATLSQIRNLTVEAALIIDHQDDLARAERKVDALARVARADLTVIKANFLGDMDQVRRLEAELDQWDAIRTDIFAAAAAGDGATAARMVKTTGRQKFSEVAAIADYIQAFAKNRARRFVDEAGALSDEVIFKTYALIALLSALIVATTTIVGLRVGFLQRELKRQATIDHLTGAPNRRHFLAIAEREFRRSQRYGDPLALAVVDLDLFKSVNDRHGHPVGDLVLQRFCAVCQASLRGSDTLGRIGGEEFAILLPHTSLAEAGEVIERVRKAIEDTEIALAQSPPLRFTGSFGLTACTPGDLDMAPLFKRADEALYLAKGQGRNRVCLRN